MYTRAHRHVQTKTIRACTNARALSRIPRVCARARVSLEGVLTRVFSYFFIFSRFTISFHTHLTPFVPSSFASRRISKAEKKPPTTTTTTTMTTTTTTTTTTGENSEKEERDGKMWGKKKEVRERKRQGKLIRRNTWLGEKRKKTKERVKEAENEEKVKEKGKKKTEVQQWKKKEKNNNRNVE